MRRKRCIRGLSGSRLGAAPLAGNMSPGGHTVTARAEGADGSSFVCFCWATSSLLPTSSSPPMAVVTKPPEVCEVRNSLWLCLSRQRKTRKFSVLSLEDKSVASQRHLFKNERRAVESYRMRGLYKVRMGFLSTPEHRKRGRTCSGRDTLR